MAADVEVFNFPETGAEIRALVLDDAPWFVAGDVCRVLGIANVPDAVGSLDEDEKGIASTDTLGGPQRVRIVNEPGLYSLILRSRKPEAKTFKRWVTHEVLPAIRQTGRYEVEPQHVLPQTLPQALRAYAAEVEARESAQRALAAAEPKADAWDTLASATGDYSVREAAYILNRDPAIDTGQNRLFGKLRELGLVDKGGTPYASHARHLRLRAGSYLNQTTGEQVATTQVRITAVGVAYLHKRMGGIRRPAFADLLREVSA